jgi:GAF domain-containing protein
MTIIHFTTPAEPDNEEQRLALIHAYGLDQTDTPADPILDGIVAEAAARFEAPIVLISIVGHDQQCFRSCIGLGVNSTPRSISFCGHAILSPRPLIVVDAATDARFAGNPLVHGPPFIRFYAGAPLIGPEQLAIGTLCIIDTRPRTLENADINDLIALAARVMTRLETGRSR